MKRTRMKEKCPKSADGFADTITHKVTLFLAACALTLAISPAMYGQATGSFSGTIADKSGSGVVGATITATSQQTGLVRDSNTDTAGHYLFPLLPVGNYTVHVDATGFQSVESK